MATPDGKSRNKKKSVILNIDNYITDVREKEQRKVNRKMGEIH